MSLPSRHFVGWTPPPHPTDVPPSMSNSLSKEEQIARVLLDYNHDDDTRSAVLTGPRSTSAPEGTNWLIGGHGPVDPYQLYRAWKDPQAFANGDLNYAANIQTFFN